MTSLKLRLAPLSRINHCPAMGQGRLIRVSKYRGDPRAVSYLVAVPDKARAIELVIRQAASLGDDIEDLGRVSEDLMAAMRLPPGQFLPINGVSHSAQQKPQSDKE